MDIPILSNEHHWECPNCDFQDVTYESKPHTRMHICPGAAMLSTPMVPAGIKCKVVAEERADYVGKECVTVNEDKKPIMAVRTVRDDGEDLAVYAPCAMAGATVN